MVDNFLLRLDAAEEALAPIENHEAEEMDLTKPSMLRKILRGVTRCLWQAAIWSCCATTFALTSANIAIALTLGLGGIVGVIITAYFAFQDDKAETDLINQTQEQIFQAIIRYCEIMNALLAQLERLQIDLLEQEEVAEHYQLITRLLKSIENFAPFVQSINAGESTKPASPRKYLYEIDSAKQATFASKITDYSQLILRLENQKINFANKLPEDLRNKMTPLQEPSTSQNTSLSKIREYLQRAVIFTIGGTTPASLVIPVAALLGAASTFVGWPLYAAVIGAFIVGGLVALAVEWWIETKLYYKAQRLEQARYEIESVVKTAELINKDREILALKQEMPNLRPVEDSQYEDSIYPIKQASLAVMQEELERTKKELTMVSNQNQRLAQALMNSEGNKTNTSVANVGFFKDSTTTPHRTGGKNNHKKNLFDNVVAANEDNLVLPPPLIAF